MSAIEVEVEIAGSITFMNRIYRDLGDSRHLRGASAEVVSRRVGLRQASLQVRFKNWASLDGFCEFVGVKPSEEWRGKDLESMNTIRLSGVQRLQS